jgi:3-phosphoshikimate 1-carboxyvinyltransferase
MHERPIKDLVNALRTIGASIEYLGKEGCPPLKIIGNVLPGGSVTVSGSTSSQFLTSLLLAAPLCAEGLAITVEGGLVSSSYVGTTLSVMRAFGVNVEGDLQTGTFKVPRGSHYSPTTYTPEGDASGATYLWGIAAISGGYVRVSNISHDSAQGDVRFVALLEQMGCKITSGTESGVPWIAVQGPDRLRSITTDMTLLPDAAQTLAVVAATADGTSTITGLSTLVVKETNRITATVNELKRCGIAAAGTHDSLIISGGAPHPAECFETYEDHRMAMAFAMLGTRYPGVVIHNPKVTSKSYPSFWDDITSLGCSIESAT